jgi:hypothetical protein
MFGLYRTDAIAHLLSCEEPAFTRTVPPSSTAFRGQYGKKCQGRAGEGEPDQARLRRVISDRVPRIESIAISSSGQSQSGNKDRRVDSAEVDQEERILPAEVG